MSTESLLHSARDFFTVLAGVLFLVPDFDTLVCFL